MSTHIRSPEGNGGLVTGAAVRRAARRLLGRGPAIAGGIECSAALVPSRNSLP